MLLFLSFETHIGAPEASIRMREPSLEDTRRLSPQVGWNITWEIAFLATKYVLVTLAPRMFRASINPTIPSSVPQQTRFD